MYLKGKEIVVDLWGLLVCLFIFQLVGSVYFYINPKFISPFVNLWYGAMIFMLPSYILGLFLHIKFRKLPTKNRILELIILGLLSIVALLIAMSDLPNSLDKAIVNLFM
ncbi:hypothetical protein C9I99_09150 [Photobacterium lutimaris]|uniref:Uncharacterized protein n=1 Tax=Photobacterium lutimaris TaxID=388278 RepID=A0A2T3IZM0_9GAMM|nr:hypothetical protein C9I99_09150 [Photobacterium lutimaris]TDR75724.1 hypothetical protein DFP78_10481 [Photobacterium lutimaris]